MKKMKEKLIFLAREKIKTYEFYIKYNTGIKLAIYQLKLELWKLLLNLLGGKK